MKLNHLFVAALALGLTHSFVLADNNGTTRATAGTTRVSTRGTVTNSISRVTTARPATIRTAGLTRVNLRRPTTTTTTPP